MPLYDRPYNVYYLDQKGKVKHSEATKLEVEDGCLLVYGTSDEGAPKRIVPMHKIAEIYRKYEDSP